MNQEKETIELKRQIIKMRIEPSRKGMWKYEASKREMNLSQLITLAVERYLADAE